MNNNKNHLIAVTVPTQRVELFSRIITLPNILELENFSIQTGWSLYTSISTQSFECIDLQFFFIIAPVFGSYLQFIFVIRAVDLLEPMYIITSVPFNIGP